MKRLFLLTMLCACVSVTKAQTISFAVTTIPCDHNGVLTATITGLTPPLTVYWTTQGTSGTTITHSGVSGLTDALTSYSGGPVYISITDALSMTDTAYYAGMPPFTYSLASTSAVCPALGSATATVVGGSSPYTYQWFDMSTMAIVGTGSPISLGGGNYGIKITDALGCVYGTADDYNMTSVYVTAPFTPTVTTTAASCTNGTATLGTLTGGTSPYSYSWSTGATTPGITGLTMGSYNVTVTDAIGCSASASAYVSQSIYISAPVTSTPATCLNSNGAVIAFGSGGTPPYTYLWSNLATTQSQTGLSAGSYDVTATDANGCLGTGYGYISTSTPITATYTSTSSLCTSATGTATLTLAGGSSPYTTTWYTTPPQTGLTATALMPGSYYFHTTDAVGCVQSGWAVVNPVSIISAAFSATAAVCTLSNGSLTVTPSGGVTPYSYLWNTSATTSGISSVPTGYYDVRITDNMGCAINKSGHVPDYSPMGVGLSATPASCIFTNDGSITATAYGGTTPYTYSWTGGGTTSTISSLLTGRYWLYVSDATGCTANL
jgi:SprB repeat